MNEITFESLQGLAKTAETPKKEEIIMETEQAVKEMTPEDRAAIDKIKATINIQDPNALSIYGYDIQTKVADFNNTILSNVKSRDIGDAGKEMTDIVLLLKNSDISKIDESKSIYDYIPFLAKGKTAIERYFARLDTVKGQIDKITADLQNKRVELQKDATLMEQLKKENFEHFKRLDQYIIAAKERIEEVRTGDIPRLDKEAGDDVMKKELIRNLVAEVERFEQKIVDLQTSRTLALQTAPQIVLVQNNDLMMEQRIQQIITHVIPAWSTQAVLAISAAKAKNAQDVAKTISDATGEMIAKNAKQLEQTTTDVIKGSQESVIPLKKLQEANDTTIRTIEKAIALQAEGKAKREAAEMELDNMNKQLKIAVQKAVDSNL